MSETHIEVDIICPWCRHQHGVHFYPRSLLEELPGMSKHDDGRGNIEYKMNRTCIPCENRRIGV